MEIDRFEKGKNKGKSKEKSKGKETTKGKGKSKSDKGKGKSNNKGSTRTATSKWPMFALREVRALQAWLLETSWPWWPEECKSDWIQCFEQCSQCLKQFFDYQWCCQLFWCEWLCASFHWTSWITWTHHRRFGWRCWNQRSNWLWLFWCMQHAFTSFYRLFKRMVWLGRHRRSWGCLHSVLQPFWHVLFWPWRCLDMFGWQCWTVWTVFHAWAQWRLHHWEYQNGWILRSSQCGGGAWFWRWWISAPTCVWWCRLCWWVIWWFQVHWCTR